MNLRSLSYEQRQAVKHDCEILVPLARQVFRREIGYDEDSIKWLAWLIEFSRNRPEELKRKLQTSIGCFLGETMIARYDGEWVLTDKGDMGVRLPSQTVAFPFLKVGKQFKNGESDSIWAMFKMAHLQRDSQPGAAPNGGPAAPLEHSEGPPSVT